MSNINRFKFDADNLSRFCGKIVKDDNQIESVLEVKLRDIDARWTKLEKSYEVLMISGDNDEDKKAGEVIWDRVVDEYYIAVSAILNSIKKFRDSLGSVPTIGQPASDNAFHCLKVPACDTQDFSGSYEEWPSFRDMFTSVYLNHTKLSPAQKLFHLRRKTIVKRFELTDDNLANAWEALKIRYENTRVLVDNQLRILFDIPNAKTENNESLQRIQSSVSDCLAMLKSLGINTVNWDPILIHLISTKLPRETLLQWEQSLESSRELPKWSQLNDFLLKRHGIVERISTISFSKSAGNSSVQSFVSQENLNEICKMCGEGHNLRTCSEFRKLNIQERVDFVFKSQCCNNCLSDAHIKRNCPSKGRCLSCHKNHHTLLHLKPQTPWKEHAPRENIFRNKSQVVTNSSQIDNSNPISVDDVPTNSDSLLAQIHVNYATNSANIMLRTALVNIECRGEIFTLRALIDPGSERTFLSERARNRLQLPSRTSRFEIIGIGGQKQTSEKECDLVLVSRKHNVRFTITAIVLPKVTSQIPAISFEISDPSALSELDLADPNFNVSAQIDLILGNDSERYINIDGIRKNICGSASAYNTIFGWVLSGPIECRSTFSFSASLRSEETASLNTLLRKFWEQEEIPNTKPASDVDIFCEEYYRKTVKRQLDGKYIVRLPFRGEFPNELSLGPSRFSALCQFTNMERTLSKDPSLHSQYHEVLREYIELDHMEETTSKEYFTESNCYSYYLPHHAVFRPESKTTKLRVVFNASRKTKSGRSLNDVLYPGPVLQSDLMTIILNWRSYQYVFNGDIQKMYRQILVDPSDRPFQRVLFQNSSREPIRDYQLKTVTFGVNCAPFLAIRTLLQLATDSEELLPRASFILRKEIYVDDILSGGHTIESALSSRNELLQCLRSAGFSLKKITANRSLLLEDLPPEDLYDSNFLKVFDCSDTKTLGLKWNAITDSFSYTFYKVPYTEGATKRQILSDVAKLFDPAGWIAPIIIRGKILIQQLWLEPIGWDDPVSEDSLKIWRVLLQDLPPITDIKIPRWLNYNPSYSIQIHGFCDASQMAYCAAVYLRISTPEERVFTHLLVAKSKVAPLIPVRLPRLELSGAVMVAKLVDYIKQSLCFFTTDIVLWSDSSIVLGWLAKPPWTWKDIYVSNRTAQIHQLLPDIIWRHVPTKDNPADLGTRGCSPSDLNNNSLWWRGPAWLSQSVSEWPKHNPLNPYEIAPNTQCLQTLAKPVDILDRFSSYTKALRVLAYILRPTRTSLHNPSRLRYSSRELRQEEVSLVKHRLIILAQKMYYLDEYSCLSQSKPISDKSSLISLNPFVDKDGLMHVNGRLADSSLPHNEKFPIIIPGNSKFCDLYLHYVHTILMHGGCIQMCRLVQTEFFIPRLKPRVKRIIHTCKTCIVYKQKSCSQIMAPLPPERCNFSLPFYTTGIDFAGPFELKSSSLRNAPYLKGYVCVFVCFATKAVHLEACSSLSTPAFRAAFDRFVGRRGLPHKIVSDNGRNFIGASRVMLREFTQFLKSVSTDVSQKYISYGFEWTFIPPHAPHMGGLWEAAVKSFKFHLKRHAGSHRFNFEEFQTVLIRIESVLNSRPISAVSNDPSDLNALTPGHFLHGAPMLAIPEPSSQSLALVNRWEKLKSIHHNFALKWKEEYIKTLHKRYRWKTQLPSLDVGDLVVVIDDMLPPNEWRLGRIDKTHIGRDNHIRIVDVKTATGIITRPIVKLCRLPYDHDPKQVTSDTPQSNNQRTRSEAIHKCRLCDRFHSIRFCQTFLNMNAEERNRAVRVHKYCTNCLARTHFATNCSSADKCKKCGSWHHTLLHPGFHPRIRLQTSSPANRSRKSSPSQQIRCRSATPSQNQHRRRSKSFHQQRPTRSSSASRRDATRNDSNSQAIPTAQSISNKKILSEAIRCLAAVLCLTEK